MFDLEKKIVFIGFETYDEPTPEQDQNINTSSKSFKEFTLGLGASIGPKKITEWRKTKNQELY